MDLGHMDEEPMPISTSKQEKKKRYPSFTVHQSETAKKLMDKHGDKIGKEVTAKVKMRVNHVSKDGYGCAIGYEMMSMDDMEDNGDTPREKESMVDFVKRKVS